MLIGQVLRCIRIAQDKKSKEIAEKLNVSIAYLCDIESGRKNVTLNIIKKFADVYQVPASKILEWEEQSNIRSLCYQEILFLCVQYECERLRNKENNINL